MRENKTRTIATLLLGTSFCLIYSILFREIPWLQKLELNVYDSLVRWHSPKKPPKEILLVELDRQHRESRVVSPEFSERVFYASLVKQLLENDAAVVVLNLNHYWRDVPDSDWQNADLVNSPLRKLVTKYSERIVLVTPISPLSDNVQTDLGIYRHFLPREDDLSEPLAPNTVQGFSEYEQKADRPESLTNIARRVGLTGKFVTPNPLQQEQNFRSAPLLAVEKFEQQQDNYHLNTKGSFPQNIGINYWHILSTFPTLNAKQICAKSTVSHCQLNWGETDLRSNVANKIVLLGFNEGRNLSTLPVMDVFAQEIPFVEYQANILASLISEQYYRIIPAWGLWSIRLAGAIVFSGIFVFNLNLSRLAYPKSVFLILFGLIGIYLSLALILWQSYYTLPIVEPLSIWAVSGVSTYVCLILRFQSQLINHQRQQIEKLQKAEQKAIVLQTRKLIQRVASDIHDTALQDLKVLMDKLELESSLDSEIVLDHLEFIGNQIREQLYSMRQMSQKLEISSFLRSGLDVGIRACLEQLVNSGKLKLKVIYNLHSLDEPIANSLWIDAREDIYRFFREAINNVMFHAQAPYGTATQVTISMWRQQNQCFLAVIDNNYQTSVAPLLQNNLRKRGSGGYGTKIMETIASELPGGDWKKTIVPNKGTVIQLSWDLSFSESIFLDRLF